MPRTPRKPIGVHLHKPADYRKPEFFYIPAKDRAQFGIAIYRLHHFWSWAVQVSEDGIFLDHENCLQTRPLFWGLQARRILTPAPIYAFPWWRPAKRKPLLVPPEVLKAASAFLRTGTVPIPLTQHPPQLTLFPAPGDIPA